MSTTDDRLDAMDRDRIKTMPDDTKDALNADPISGEPGAHPVGTGIGAAVGAVVGGVIGSVIPGPGSVAGSVIGATAVPVVVGAVGAVVGGLAGKASGEAANPTDEDAYWRANHTSRPYYSADAGRDYDTDYAPAYGLGTATRSDPSYAGRTFEDAEPAMKDRWEAGKDKSRLSWDEAKQAARDSWNRMTK